MDRSTLTPATPFVATATPLGEATHAWVLVHGRGDSAHNFLQLAPELLPQSPVDRARVAVVATLAPGGLWYPYSFLAPWARNQPYIDNALAALDRTFEVLKQRGIPQQRTYLLGFSQGACLALEFAARRGGEFGGVAALSGALITLGHTQPLHGPVLMASSSGDPHIPAERFERSVQVLRDNGAAVTHELYPGSFHGLRRQDLEHARSWNSA